MQNVKVTRKGKKGPVAARLFIIFARNAPTAAIFRRGPSPWVQLIKWRTDTDVFEPGQWFHGRIYERRADLTPDGSLLIYFAHKITGRTLADREYTYAWTAVSKPPYLTALALWPKGDCWHGGGLFKDNYTVLLNHRRQAAKPHPDHKPNRLRVILKDEVQGEDDPVFSERLERDGWALRQEWEVENRGYSKMFLTVQPEVREKAEHSGSRVIQLTRSIHGLDYSEEFQVMDRSLSLSANIERASWADWDQRGRLVFARDGKILTGWLDPDAHLVEQELADFNSSKPSSLPAPDWATQW